MDTAIVTAGVLVPAFAIATIPVLIALRSMERDRHAEELTAIRQERDRHAVELAAIRALDLAGA